MQRRFREQAGWHGDAQPVHLGGRRLYSLGYLDLLRLGGEALAVQRFDEVFDLLAVGPVIKGDAAIAVDGEVVHLVGEAGRAQVFSRSAGDLADSGHQPLAVGTGQVVSQGHFSFLLDFW